jgi:hypothetical protein
MHKVLDLRSKMTLLYVNVLCMTSSLSLYMYALVKSVRLLYRPRLLSCTLHVLILLRVQARYCIWRRVRVVMTCVLLFHNLAMLCVLNDFFECGIKLN